jgi:hypothetical protein
VAKARQSIPEHARAYRNMPEHTKAYRSTSKRAKSMGASQSPKAFGAVKVFGAVKSVWSCQKRSELAKAFRAVKALQWFIKIQHAVHPGSAKDFCLSPNSQASLNRLQLPRLLSGVSNSTYVVTSVCTQVLPIPPSSVGPTMQPGLKSGGLEVRKGRDEEVDCAEKGVSSLFHTKIGTNYTPSFPLRTPQACPWWSFHPQLKTGPRWLGFRWGAHSPPLHVRSVYRGPLPPQAPLYPLP